MSHSSTRSRAFTMVELLVVIGIIGLLMAILLPVVRGARQSALSAACASNLRQVYMAQTAYHDTYKRYTPVNFYAEPRDYWGQLLRPYFKKSETDSDKQGPLSVMQCPASDASADDVSFSYGINTFLEHPNWKGVRTRKGTSELILIADKGISTIDLLRSEEGCSYFPNQTDPVWLSKAVQHSNYSAFRHSGKRLDRSAYAKDATADHYNPVGFNAVMSDGHVECLSRHDLLLRSARWSAADLTTLTQISDYGPCCQ